MTQQQDRNMNRQHQDHSHRMGLKRRSNTLNSSASQTASLADETNQQQQQQQHLQPYGDLIGAIDQGTSSTRFLVFEKGSGRLVASSQIEIKRLTPREGWVEIDPSAIMSSVYATMANVHDQLLAKRDQLTASSAGKLGAGAHTTRSSETAPGNQLAGACGHPSLAQTSPLSHLLKCIGICNQRESAVVWDSTTGQPLYNVIVWMDNRTKDIVDDMIDSIPGRDFNRLKDKTGLPMSTYFSAFKLKWLLDNVPEVRRARDERRLLVGTVDSWILWNLTGKHLTDVTNASRTFLMDIETLQWDKSLCKQFQVPMEVLPKILSSADDFGALQFGPFMGTPITGVIGDQSAALFGHNCLQLGQTKATFGTGCFIMQNIGPGPLSGALSGVQREAKRGLVTTVGFKLKDKPACYALEGSIKIAGAALTWLRDNMQLISNYEECDELVNTTTHSAGVFFVPALGGLYSPYWDPNAAGLFIGLSQFSRREHLVRATFDAIAYQTNDILSLMRGVANGLMIDGGLCKSDNLCQILADITGCDIVRPSMCETSALGAAMVAGCGAGIWDYEALMAHSNTPYEYTSSANQTHHYPHESLHHDDNKFSPLLPVKTFQQQHPQELKDQDKPKQQQVHQQPLAQAQQQQLQQRHQRRSLRSRALMGGRLVHNLDGGGVVNDDAGGGGHGRPSPERHDEDRGYEVDVEGAIYLADDDEEDEEREEDRASSCGLLASCSETDYDAGIAISSSGKFTVANSECNETVQGLGATLAPVSVIEESPAGGGVGVGKPAASLAKCPVTGAQSRQTMPENNSATASGNKSRLTNGLMHLNQHHVNHVAPSSGYNSGDNFESATTNSAGSCQLLTDSIRCRLSDSPTGSQTTDLMSSVVSMNGGRDSVATCTADLNTTTARRAPVAAVDATAVAVYPDCGLTGLQDHNSFPHSYPSAALVEPVVQEQQDKFVARAEDVADEVHEFGGRDSFGEEGYDSSTVSFDSYDDEEEEDDEEDVQDVDKGCDTVIADKGNTGAMVSEGGESTQEGEGAKAANAADHHHHHHHHHHHGARRRQASLLEKQVDVFQPYISLEHRTDLVNTWRLAVGRSMQWTKVHHEEIRRIDYQRLSSLPISMYVFFSIGMVALSGLLSTSSGPTLT